MKNLQQMQQMLKQVQQFQEQLQKQLDELVVETTAGAGMVRLKMNGQKQLIALEIEPEIFTARDAEMLQNLIMAAVNDASHKVDEQLSSQVGNLSGALNLPNLA